MSDRCRCPSGNHSAQVIGSPLGTHPVGHWAPLPGPTVAPNSGNSGHVLKQCTCGCNEYQGTSRIAPTDADSLDIPALPIQLDYVDDDTPSDDHEYVSIKITDLADMQSAIRSCTCQDL